MRDVLSCRPYRLKGEAIPNLAIFPIISPTFSSATGRRSCTKGVLLRGEHLTKHFDNADTRFVASRAQSLPLPFGASERRINWRYAAAVGTYHLLALLAFVPWFYSTTGAVLAFAGMCAAVTMLMAIDSKEQLRSFEKANLRDFGIVDVPPMPSYKDRLSAQELADVVSYLVSLKGKVN